MPCYYTGTKAGDAELDAQEARKALTNVTSMLCNLCAMIEATGCDDETGMPAGTQKWWKEHKKVDSKRKKRRK